MSYDFPSLRAHFVEGTRKGDPRWSDDLVPVELQELWLVKVEDERIAAIKQQASNIILNRYPLWKQQNLHARFTELVDKAQSGEELTADEQIEKSNIKSVWTWAKAVRAESDRLELDANATPNWPD